MVYLIRTAQYGDVESIFQMIKYYAGEGVILERSIEDIKDNISNFLVAVSNNTIIGLVTHFNYGKNLKEVRSLAVDKNFHNMGIGQALLKELVKHIQAEESSSKIFTLTYRPDFFRKNGFVTVPKDDFPEKIWKDCDNCKDREKCGETALVYKSM